MRALGLIITCVLLLAIMQASYLIVDARRPHPEHHGIPAKTDNHHRQDNRHHDDKAAHSGDHPAKAQHISFNVTIDAKDTAGTNTKTMSYNGSTPEATRRTHRPRGSYRNYWRRRRRYCRRFPEVCKQQEAEKKALHTKKETEKTEAKDQEQHKETSQGRRKFKLERLLNRREHEGRRGRKNNWAIFFNHDNEEPKNVTAQGRRVTEARRHLGSPPSLPETNATKEDQIEISVHSGKHFKVTKLEKTDDVGETQQDWLKLKLEKKAKTVKEKKKRKQKRRLAKKKKVPTATLR